MDGGVAKEHEKTGFLAGVARWIERRFGRRRTGPEMEVGLPGGPFTREVEMGGLKLCSRIEFHQARSYEVIVMAVATEGAARRHQFVLRSVMSTRAEAHAELERLWRQGEAWIRLNAQP